MICHNYSFAKMKDKMAAGLGNILSWFNDKQVLL